MAKRTVDKKTAGLATVCRSLPAPAELATAQSLLIQHVRNFGVQISAGLGSDIAIALEEIFVNLQLLPKQEQAKLFEKVSFSSLGEFERKLSARQSTAGADGEVVELDALFEAGADSACPQNVLALGGAGSGKTTVFLQMLVYLWCTKGVWSEKFDLVFGVELREASVQQATSLRDLLWAMFGPLEMEEEEVGTLARYFRTNQSRLCLVVDGLDECDLHSCSAYMQKLVKRQALNGAQVIVTSRVCDAAKALSQCGKYDRQLEVLGFSESNVREYVCKVVGDGADSMMTEISANAELAGMMRTPVFAGLACELFVAGKKISACCTSLYECMVLRLFERSCEKVYNSFSEIPAPEMQTLLELSRFSFRMLAEKKLVFEESDLSRARLSEKARCLGLLMTFKDGTSVQRRQYRFVHLSLQEFLSAWFMKECVVKEACDASKLVDHLGECSGHLTMFWRFLVAMCESDVSDALLEKLWRGMSVEEQALVQGEDVVPSAVRLADEMIHNPGVLCNDVDFEMVEKGLGLRLSYEEMKKLANGLLEKSHGKGNGHSCVQSKIPRDRDLTDELYLQTLMSVWRQHAEVARGSTIYEILLPISAELADACKEVLHPAGQLGGVEVVADAHKPMPKVYWRNHGLFLQLLESYHEHSLYQGRAASVSCPVIGKIIEVSHGFDLTLVRLSLSQCKAVEHAMCQHAALVQEVNLFKCYIGNAGLSILAPTLCHCTAITKLNLGLNDITDVGLLVLILSSLSNNLEGLRLWGNPIGDEGFTLLSASLQNCKMLTVLDIYDMSLTGVSLPAVALVMEQCNKLVWLNVRGIDFRSASREAEVMLVQLYAQHPTLGVRGGFDGGLLWSKDDVSPFLHSELRRVEAAKRE